MIAEHNGTLCLGVDLGGTKMEAVLLRVGNEPQIVARRRIATEAEHGYAHVVARVAKLMTAVARDGKYPLSNVPAIGIGMPGSFSFVDGVALVKNSNTVCLNGRPFQDDLATELGRRVSFANDANCFALAEAVWGAARDARVVFGVILGTGVGGGVVLKGPEVWAGAQGIAGEWGHMVLEPRDGLACYCGKRGCVETYLSGPAFEAAYAARAGLTEKVPLHEIGTRAKQGDSHARAVIDERMEVFGRAMAAVLGVLDPNVVVLGGGASNLDAWYTEGVAAVERWIFNDELRTRIVQHTLGDSAGVLGAALVGVTAPPAAQVPQPPNSEEPIPAARRTPR